MAVRLFAVFFVAAIVLVIGGIRGLMTDAPASIPGAEAVVPAGGVPLTCEQLKQIKVDIVKLDLNPHDEQIALKVVNTLIANCDEANNDRVPSQLGRSISGAPFTLNFLGDENFVDVFGTFDPSTGNYTGNGTGTVAGVPNVTVVLELNIDEAGNVTGTYTMGAGGELPGGQPGGYTVTGVVELNTPTPTPSPTATASPTDTPTPTPTTPPGQQVTWADSNCKDGVNPVDSLLVLRGDAGLSANTNECPPMGASIEVLLASQHVWGDVDCKDGMTPVDSLKILRYDAGLSVSQEPGCPAMASTVTVTEL